jgi:hypothetical protein
MWPFRFSNASILGDGQKAHSLPQKRCGNSPQLSLLKEYGMIDHIGLPRKPGRNLPSARTLAKISFKPFVAQLRYPV